MANFQNPILILYLHFSTWILGPNYVGKYHKYTSSNDDLHITFDEEDYPELQEFKNNVNSAVCTCISLPIYYPFFHSYYPVPNYGLINTMLYPFIPYANFLHGRNWFYPWRSHWLVKYFYNMYTPCYDVKLHSNNFSTNYFP